MASVIQCHPIDVLEMRDESGRDIKLLARPIAGMNSGYDHIEKLSQLPENLGQQIVHFFSHYKKLEPKKWTEIGLWLGQETAYKEIMLGVERYRNNHQ